MSPTLTTFLYEAANFLVLAAALGWLFFRPVRQALADRRAKFEAESAQAAEKLAAAEKARQESDATRANLQKELNELRTRELEAARRQAEQILAEARTQADREREMTRRQLARISETQQDALAEISASAAAELVGRLLEQIQGTELQSALVDSACRQLATLPAGELGSVKVESSQPLSQEQRERVEKALDSKAAELEFRTADDLGAGVRISTGKGLVDATVRGLTHFARQSLVNEMHRRGNNHHILRSDGDA